MSRGSGTPWAIGCVAALILGLGAAALLFVGGALLLGGGLVAGVAWAPTLAWRWFTEDAPLADASTALDPAARVELAMRVCPSLMLGLPVALTGDEVVALLAFGEAGPTAPVRLAVDDQGYATLRASIAAEDGRYLNVVAGGSFALDGGWMSSATVDELRVGPLELGGYVAGQELAMDVNQQLARQRAEDADLDATLARVAHLSTVPGGVQVELQPGDPPALCR
ncbi:MAG: hypothetical protein R3F59_24670 [Myxococcota bacterium]